MLYVPGGHKVHGDGRSAQKSSSPADKRGKGMAAVCGEAAGYLQDSGSGIQIQPDKYAQFVFHDFPHG